MENGRTDDRRVIYDDLHGNQLEAEEAQNRHSARQILGKLFEVYRPASILDVGCGLGTWLSAALELGVSDVRGVDGPWLEKRRLRLPEGLVSICDLEAPFDLGRRFDLTISLEVAEHLEEKAARGFIESLTNHSDVVLFSAAIPLQGGHHHVNEQWPEYWCALFEERGYEALDFLRGDVWWDDSILWWLRQNLLVFARTPLIEANAALRAFRQDHSPRSIVHPEVYLARLKAAQAQIEEHARLIALLSSGGTFSVKKNPDGTITIARV